VSASNDLFDITASERRTTSTARMPERENNQRAAGHAVVDVIPGAGKIKTTEVTVVRRSTTSADSRLLGEHFERLRQVQANRVWGREAIVSPPQRGLFNLLKRSLSDLDREHEQLRRCGEAVRRVPRR